MVDINKLLQVVAENGASDLHLAVGAPPVLRLNGDLRVIQGEGTLTTEHIDEVLRSITSAENYETFHREREMDFSYGMSGQSRFRVNACYQRGTVSLCFRGIPSIIPSVEELGLPESCISLVNRKRGLVLVTGPTGSGKSTTLAAMIDHINGTSSCRIITLEDPIEFLYQNKKSMVIQREIGGDTNSFSEALRRVLRQDPDVILVGELRDLESIALALAAAETGHLVLGTLHTNRAAETIERLVGVFPAGQQQQIVLQLSISLTGIIFQFLLPKIEGGRAAAYEVLVGTTAIKNLIRQNQIPQIRSYMLMGSQHGMITAEQSLVSLIQRSLVTTEDAFARAPDRGTLAKLMELEGLEVPKEYRSAGVPSGVKTK